MTILANKYLLHILSYECPACRVSLYQFKDPAGVALLAPHADNTAIQMVRGLEGKDYDERLAEVPCFAQPRAEKAEGRPHGSLQLLWRGAEGRR